MFNSLTLRKTLPNMLYRKKKRNLQHLSFPPGPEPSEIVYYNVPFSDPPVALLFSGTDLKPNRIETYVDKCFQAAVIECSDRRKHFAEMVQGYHVWLWDDVRLWVSPLDIRRFLRIPHPLT